MPVERYIYFFTVRWYAYNVVDFRDGSGMSSYRYVALAKEILVSRSYLDGNSYVGVKWGRL